MTQRSAAARTVLIIAAACLFGFAVVSGGHVHQRTSSALQADCQLCMVGQVRAGCGDLPLVRWGLVLLGWSVRELSAVPRSGAAVVLPAPRAPPLR